MSASAPSAAHAKVLVLWADDRSANLGVRALARGVVAIIRSAWGDGVEIDFQDLAPSPSGFSPSVGMARRDFGSRSGPIKSWLRNYDLVVDTGAGDSFADIYGWRRVFRMIYVQLAARRLGIPVVLTPQTVGPFTTLRMRTLARRALARATVVAVRDPASATYARRLGRRDLIQSTDVVFALPLPTVSERRDVLLNVSGLLWSTSSHGDPQRYQESVRRLIEGLRSRGRTVTLLAHVLDHPSPDNDALVVRRLGQELGLEAVVPNDLDDVRAVIAGSRLVVGARMHACLNALSMGVPAIAWAYSRKFAPLLADIGWEHTIDLRTAADPAADTFAVLDSFSETEWAAQLAEVRQRTTTRITPLVQALRSLTP